MKSFCHILLFLGGTAFAGETISKELPFHSGQSLDIDLKTGGAIEIEGWDQEGLWLEYELRGKEKDNAVVETEETANGLKISCRFRLKSWKSSFGINLKIKMPHQANIYFYSSGGNVTLRDVEGLFQGKTMGGVVRLEGLVGEAKITTMGGNVFVSDSELNGRVKTMGGNIEFTDVLGNIDGSTMGGNVIYNNAKFAPDPQDASYTPEDVVRISTMGGEIQVDEAPFGAHVKTMGGGIRIGSAAHFAQATTMGGDIEIDEIDGWVKVKTMGGDVRVNMVGDPRQGRRDVEISSMGGEIYLSVPRGLSMDFDIELVFTKNSKQNYKIISDYPIEEEVSGRWNYLKGTPRKTIFGKAQVHGGKHKVKIHTINGNIHIREAE